MSLSDVVIIMVKYKSTILQIMAPVKFGLFKARSRDYQEQPSTENLLHSSNSSEHGESKQFLYISF